MLEDKLAQGASKSNWLARANRMNSDNIGNLSLSRNGNGRTKQLQFLL